MQSEVGLRVDFLSEAEAHLTIHSPKISRISKIETQPAMPSSGVANTFWGPVMTKYTMEIKISEYNFW